VAAVVLVLTLVPPSSHPDVGVGVAAAAVVDVDVGDDKKNNDRRVSYGLPKSHKKNAIDPVGRLPVVLSVVGLSQCEGNPHKQGFEVQ
jgi:hypothetical protein